MRVPQFLVALQYRGRNLQEETPMAAKTAPVLSDVGASLKKALGKKGLTAAQLAAKLNRTTGKGLGPALGALVALGLAVKNDDGTYSKPQPVK
jgi:hypothetical protein